MKKKVLNFIILTLSFFCALYADTVHEEMFSYRIDENRFPDGEYVLLRSYRNITQLVIAEDLRITLFSDRDNKRDSEIFSSSYSRLTDTVLQPEKITQWQFNVMTEKILMKGWENSASANSFDGAEKFLKALINGTAKTEKNEGELTIYQDSSMKSMMVINSRIKKLIIRNKKNDHTGKALFYEVYIDETSDIRITELIRSISSEITRTRAR